MPCNHDSHDHACKAEHDRDEEPAEGAAMETDHVQSNDTLNDDRNHQMQMLLANVFESATLENEPLPVYRILTECNTNG